MTRRHCIALFLLFATATTGIGCGSGDEDAAVDVATAWVGLLDAGKLEEAWKQSAPVFRNNLSLEDFTKSIEGSRNVLGKLISRKVRTAQAAHSLPNVPRGQYVVVQFDSVFEKHPAMVETVTTKLIGDTWQVQGYRSR